MISAMSATAVRGDWVGRVIDGRFVLLKWLGGSEHSDVFLTKLPGDTAQNAAIKLIPSDTEAEDRLASWASAARFSHPHLVHVFHSGRCEIDGASLLYMVTEFADEVLGEILPVRALTPEEMKDMLGPVLDALAYLHAREFVHGRIKPSNILAVNDVLKISADSLVAAGSPPGYSAGPTPYDAPEWAGGELSPASDLWSLGVTVVEALTQRAPEWNKSSDSAPVVPDSIPEPFARMVHGCLEPDPARRFTLEEVRASLDPAWGSLRVSAPPLQSEYAMPVSEPADESSFKTSPGPGLRIESRTPAAKPRLRLLISAAVVLIAACALLWLHSHEPQTSPPRDTRESAPAAAKPESQQKPPAGIAASPQGERQAPPAASRSAPPLEAPPRTAGNQPMGGPFIKGEVAQRVMPDVLPAASQSIHGTVRVRVRINVGPDGNVSSGSFDSPGPSRYFARIAMDAAQKWTFKAARENGQPVPSVWVLEFRFTRGATDVVPAELTP